jgi:hypothetical protein
MMVVVRRCEVIVPYVQTYGGIAAPGCPVEQSLTAVGANAEACG